MDISAPKHTFDALITTYNKNKTTNVQDIRYKQSLKPPEQHFNTYK